MRQVSHRQAQKNRELAKIKKELSPFCCICGRPGSDLMHLIPKSVYPEYYTEPLNLAIGCRECHKKYDNDLSFRRKQKHLYNRIKSFDENAANKYFKI